MNRVDHAIQDGRCVLAIGGRALADAEVQMELRRRSSLPFVALGASPAAPAVAVTETSMQPALSAQGGVIVLVEPEAAPDGRGLAELGRLVAQASHKPRLIIAARAFNPFTLPLPLRMLKMEQERRRARDFLALLPAVAPVPRVAEPSRTDVRRASAKKPRLRAPRQEFVGREEELAQLEEFLATGGPIVVAGPAGIGRRWLVTRALDGRQCRRIPDILLQRGSQFDTLFARLAAFLEQVGDKRLADAHRTPEERPVPDALVDLMLECLQDDSLSDMVLVIYGVDHFMRDDGSFHRNGRLEMLLTGLLRGRYAPRILFVSQRIPTFYREGEGANLRVLALGGLKGRELHHVFTACRMDDAPRDKMGEVHNRTHGHPIATRAFALSTRDGRLDALLADARFLHMEHEGDLDTLSRSLRNRVDKLNPELTQALARIAHLRSPCKAELLQLFDINRETRIALQSRGLLESLAVGGERVYYVHDLVKKHLPRREAHDFSLYETLAQHFVERFQKARGLERLALGQEANFFATAARRLRLLVRVGYPDQDALVSSVRELLYGYKPRIEMAEERINRVVNQDPAHTEGFLLKVEVAVARNASAKGVQNIYSHVEGAAPTPELFHHEASWRLDAQKPSDVAGAIDALRRGCERYPRNGRMRRRLAGLLRKEHKTEEAIAVLREAIDVEPMMPDSYSLMGEIHTDMGMAHWGEATSYLEEALRLSPNDALNLTRLGRLWRLKGYAELDARVESWEKAEEYFRKATQVRAEYGYALLEWATLQLDRPGEQDLDRVAWMLNQAERQRRSPPELRVLRARLRARRGHAQKSEVLIRRLVSQDPKNYGARAALGEIQYARGRVFEACASYQRAQEDAPPDAPERIGYEVILSQLRALIESGEAIEIQKRAEQEEAAGGREPDEGPAQPRARYERTTRRRRRGEGREQAAPPAEPADQAAPSSVDETHVDHEVAVADGGVAAAGSTSEE